MTEKRARNPRGAGRHRVSDEPTVVLPALRVPKSVKAKAEKAARAAGQSLSDFRRALLIRGTSAPTTRAESPAKPEPRAKSAKAVARLAEPFPRVASKKCECARPRPPATGYGICTGCGKKR